MSQRVESAKYRTEEAVRIELSNRIRSSSALTDEEKTDFLSTLSKLPDESVAGVSKAFEKNPEEAFFWARFDADMDSVIPMLSDLESKIGWIGGSVSKSRNALESLERGADGKEAADRIENIY